MLKTFSDFNAFQDEARKMGVTDDLAKLLSLDLTFFENYPQYSIINLRDYGEEPNNMLILSEAESILYSTKRFLDKDYAMFKHTLEKKHGESSVLAYLVLRDVLRNYSERFEKINSEIDEMEALLDADRIVDLGKALRKLTDKVEDFQDLMIKLADRQVTEVNTQYIEYDYDVLTAKSRHMLDRCRSHAGQVTGLRNEVELKAAKDLNKRIIDLTDIMKKLTAITVILLIPNIIAGHYGMNFPNMPEFSLPWGYPAVTVASLGLAILLAIYFRKRGWL
jgi:magnesium transporter